MVVEYSISAAQWESLKGELLSGKDGANESVHAALQCIESHFLATFECDESAPSCTTTRAGSAVTTPSRSSTRRTTRVVAISEPAHHDHEHHHHECHRPAMQDAETQLHTVRLAYFSRYVLACMHARRTSRRLARLVGVLAARVAILSEDLARALALALGASADGAPPPEGTAASPSTPARWRLLGQPVAGRVAGALHEESIAALRAMKAYFPRHMFIGSHRECVARTLAQWESLPLADAEAAAAATSRVVQVEDDGKGEREAGGMTQLPPFVCRRCRQDQRAAYHYDDRKRRLDVLGGTREAAAAVTGPREQQIGTLPRRAAPPPLPPPLDAYAPRGSPGASHGSIDHPQHPSQYNRAAPPPRRAPGGATALDPALGRGAAGGEDFAPSETTLSGRQFILTGPVPPANTGRASSGVALRSNMWNRTLGNTVMHGRSSPRQSSSGLPTMH